MAKKKRRASHKPAASKPAVIAPAVLRAPVAPSPASRKILYGFVLLLLAAFLGLAFYFSLRPSATKRTDSDSPPTVVAKDSRTILAALSGIDFSTMEPQVAEKIRKLRSEVESNPESAGAWGKLAMNLDAHDLRTESIDCYKRAAALDPKDFRWPYFCAIALGNIGSPESLAMFQRSENLRADYSPLHIRYGEALLNASRLEEAADEFRAALSKDLHSSQAHVGLARVAMFLGDLEECKAQLALALNIDPRHGEAHGLLAELYRRMNKKEDASQELQIAQQLPKEKPLQDQIYNELANEGISSTWYETRGRAYLEQGTYEKAISEMEASLRARPDPRIYDTLGVLYQKLGKYSDAVRYHQQAIKMNPNSAGWLNNLASAFYGIGNVEDAIATSEQAKSADPLFAISYINLGIFYTRIQKPELAVRSLREGRKSLPENTGIASRLAWMLATSPNSNVRDGKAAVELAKMVCDRTQNRDPQALDVLAAAYAEAGDFAKAVQAASLAHQISNQQKRTALANQIATHLQLYRSNLPFYER